MLKDRVEAGRRLAQRLSKYRDRKPVVLALPRGGVPVAFEIASALHAPLGLVLVRKVGAPWQPELALGAVADGEDPACAINQDVLRALGLEERDLESEIAAQLREIERRRKLYGKRLISPSLTGATAIVVDDGIATGATTLAALRSVRRRQPGWVVLAVPVAPADALARLAEEVDEIVCLETPADLGAISLFYRDFPQVPDHEVMELLERAAATAKDAD